MTDIYTYTLTDDDHPSMCVLFDPDIGIEAVAFGDQERSDELYIYDEPPAWWAPLSQGGTIFAETSWVSIDAWRGHVDWEVSKGWVQVSSGWVTSYPDDSVGHKLEASNVYEKMLENPPDFPVAWFFGPSSNVFSTISDVYIQHFQRNRWARYLASLGSSEDKFSDAFH